MSMIFRDAATSLRDHNLSVSQPSSNVKKIRLPLSQARSIKFGNTGRDGTGVSSGPSSQHLSRPYQLAYASDTAPHGASGVSTYHSMTKPMTEASSVIVGTLTNKSSGVATPSGESHPEGIPRFRRASLSSQIEDDRKTPIRSGFTTPVVSTPNEIENPEEVKYPILENRSLLRSSSNASSLGSDNDGLNSTHGVPFILPFPDSNAEEALHSSIDTWLNGIVEATSSGLSDLSMHSYGTEELLVNDVRLAQSVNSDHTSPTRPQASSSKLKPNLRSPSGTSSNKENLNPLKYSPSSSPIHSPENNLEVKNLSRFAPTPNQRACRHPNVLHFARSPTPQGHLDLPSKRKRSHVDKIGSSKAKAETAFARRDFTIHKDQLSEALEQLSPHVERYRKGRGPKKERCMSYWDKDILNSAKHCVPLDLEHGAKIMGKGKEVLRESKVAGDKIDD